MATLAGAMYAGYGLEWSVYPASPGIVRNWHDLSFALPCNALQPRAALLLSSSSLDACHGSVLCE